MPEAAESLDFVNLEDPTLLNWAMPAILFHLRKFQPVSLRFGSYYLQQDQTFVRFQRGHTR